MSIMSKLFGRDDIGIDLGAANMRVWIKDKGLVLEEPSAITLAISREEMEVEVQGQQDSKHIGKPCKYRVLAIGAEAGDMLGKTPGNLVVIRPMKGGVVCDYDITKKMLRYCFAHQKVKDACKGGFRRPRAVIAVPLGITEVEKRVVEDAAHAAGVGNVFLIESIMSAAIGAGLPIAEPKGCLIVDIGASATNMAVISLADIVHSRVLRIGGDAMTNAIIEYMQDKHNLRIGEREAEDIKIKIGSAYKQEMEADYEIKRGSLSPVKINSREIREEALAVVLCQLEEALRELLDRTEPELTADLVENGIVLTGGGALLSGLDKRLADATGLPVQMADNPAHATIEGVNVVLGELDYLSKHSKK